MNNEKTYIQGVSVKEIQLKSGGILKMGINKEKFLEHIKSIPANEKGYINLGISQRKEVGKYGDTHSVWLDTWKPEQRQQPMRKTKDEEEIGL